jgi:sugar O-acyltransferase (sialic acid O-acetyltransferase NeuD family)
MTTPVVLFGAGLQCKVCIDILESEQQCKIIGIVDSNAPIKSSKYGYTVIGRQNELNDLISQYGRFSGIITIGDNYSRFIVYKDLMSQNIDFEFINAIHKSAIIAKSAKLGVGLLIMAGVIINSDSIIGDFAFLSTGAQLEHDGKMKKFSHLSAGSITGGKVTIGEFSTITLGVTILDRINIGDNVVIGSGSLVLKDIPSNVLAYGNPCKVIRTRKITDQFLKSG